MQTFRRLGPAGWLAVLWSALPPLGSLLVFYQIAPISHWLREHQSYGPVIYALALTGLCGVGLLPTYASCALGGWAFGFSVGLTAAIIAFTAASMIGYWIAHFISGQRLMNIIHDKPKWQIIYDALLGGSTLKTFFIVFLMRLAPNSPFALNNLLFAATGVRWWIYLLGTFCGILPRSAAVVYAASHLETLSPSVREQKWVVVVGILVTIAVLTIIGAIAQHALKHATKSSGAGREESAERSPATTPNS